MRIRKEKPTQTVSSVTPMTLNLQTRPFAPVDTEDSAPVKAQNKSSGYKYNPADDLLLKLSNSPIEARSQSNYDVVQRHTREHFAKVSAKKELASMQIQAKLNIGKPNDKYEKEADVTAAKVVQQINSSSQEGSVQKQKSLESEDEELQMKPVISKIQRQESMEDEDKLQTKSLVQRRESLNGGEASTDLESSIQSARGSGQSLDPKLQEKMGQAMGADFSGVKVHTDSQSDQLNQSIQAKAFTTGQDVFFRQGSFDPSSRSGQELIAHELTHVVQQNAGAVQRSVELENDRKSRSENKDKGKSVEGSQSQTGRSIQRQFTGTLSDEYQKDQWALYKKVMAMVLEKAPHLKSYLHKDLIRDIVDNKSFQFKDSFGEVKDLVDFICQNFESEGLSSVAGSSLKKKYKDKYDFETSVVKWKERRTKRQDKQFMANLKKKMKHKDYEAVLLLLYGVNQKSQLEAVKEILDENDPEQFTIAIEKANRFAMLVASSNWEIQQRMQSLDGNQFERASKKVFANKGSSTKQLEDMQKDRKHQKNADRREQANKLTLNTHEGPQANVFFAPALDGIRNLEMIRKYGLTNAEAIAIWGFSQSSYFVLNPLVHGGNWLESVTKGLTNAQKKILIDEGIDQSDLLRSGVKKLPAKNTTIFRGEVVEKALYKQKYGGKTLSPKTFQSNATDTNNSEAFAAMHWSPSKPFSILLEIKANRAYDIKPFSAHPAENELLTLDDASFEIESIDEKVTEKGKNYRLRKVMIKAKQTQ